MLQHYYSTESRAQLLSKPNTLCVVDYSEPCSRSDHPGFIQTGVKAAEKGLREVWTVDRAVQHGIKGRVCWNQADDVLCTAIWLSGEQCLNIESSTHLAYQELLSFIQESSCPHPFRFWNYLPHINQGQGDNEIYKRFCVGRHRAFLDKGIPKESFPAASALGHHSEGAVIYAFSSNVAGIQHENPRQQKAYCYPREYGPSSPSFSRATSLTLFGKAHLFISGTASIIGHQTTFQNEFEGQLVTTLDNLSLLTEGQGSSLQALKVYLRNLDFLDRAKTLVQARFPNIDTLFAVADVCRENLLVEIEGHT